MEIFDLDGVVRVYADENVTGMIFYFICTIDCVYQGKVNTELFLGKTFINLLNSQKTLFKHPPPYTMS